MRYEESVRNTEQIKRYLKKLRVPEANASESVESAIDKRHYVSITRIRASQLRYTYIVCPVSLPPYRSSKINGPVT